MANFIPKRYRYLFSQIKNSLVGGYAQTHYSQFGEDIVLAKLLSYKRGFYIDVGAHHPRRYSNTYLLYKKGWRGINIDPNPDTITLFRRARPFDRNICIGVGKLETTMSYYMFSDPAVNTFVKKEAERWMGKDWIEFLGIKDISIEPLATILQGIQDLPQIDLLTIDVEGLDLEVLESNDWQAHKPRVVVVEDATFQVGHAAANQIYTFMTERGYVLKSFVGASLIFSQQET